jgi:acyl-CoA synthetase (NDP forming)
LLILLGHLPAFFFSSVYDVEQWMDYVQLKYPGDENYNTNSNSVCSSIGGDMPGKRRSSSSTKGRFSSSLASASAAAARAREAIMQKNQQQQHQQQQQQHRRLSEKKHQLLLLQEQQEKQNLLLRQEQAQVEHLANEAKAKRQTGDAESIEYALALSASIQAQEVGYGCV